MDKGVIMDKDEKDMRCTNAVKHAVNNRCKVYSRWMVHDLKHGIPDGCDDCAWDYRRD